MYDYEECLVDFTPERKKCVVRTIESNNTDIAKDTVIMAANAFTVGVGVLGVCFFGKKVLYYDSLDEKVSSNSKLVAKLYGLPVLLSCVPVYMGIKCFLKKKEDLKHNLAYRRMLIKNLENLNSKDV